MKKEIRDKIIRDQEDYQDEIEKRDLAAKGVVAGTAASLLGGGIYKMSNDLGKKVLSGNYNVTKGNEKTIIEDVIKVRRLGKALLGVGIPVAGIAAYKHYKYKKKDKEDDNKA